jgi:dienelactone hydrolase
MKTQAIRVKLRDGEMGAYVAVPDRTPAGAIIAIMEIWHSRIHRDLVGRTCAQKALGL